MGKLSEGKQMLVVFLFFVVICIVLVILCTPKHENVLTIEIEELDATATIENFSVNKTKNYKPFFSTKIGELKGSKRVGVHAEIKITFDTPLRISAYVEDMESYLSRYFSPIMVFGIRTGTDWQGTASIIDLSYTMTEAQGITEVIIEIHETMKHDVNSITILMNRFRRGFHIRKSYWR